MNYRNIGIECDSCGHRCSNAKINDYYALRCYLHRLGWVFTASRDYCAGCSNTDKVKKLKLVNYYSQPKGDV